MRENDAMENDRQEAPQVKGFTPVDIFAPQPKQYRLAKSRLPGRIYRPVRPLPPEPAPESAPARLTPAEEADALYLHAVGGMWVTRILSWLFPAFSFLAGSVFYHGVILAMPVVRRAVVSPVLAEKMRLRRPPVFSALLAALCGLSAALAAPGLTAAWSALLGRFGLVFSARPVAWPSVPLLLVRSALFAAAGEELFFRGYLLSAWEDRRGWHCVPITALLFALAHASVQGFPAQLIMGLLLGMLCVRGGSVFCAMAAHASFNAASILLSAAWEADGALQLAAVSLCGAALCAAFYLLMARVSGRKTVNLPSGATSGWQGAVALYAAAVSALLALAWDAAGLLV